MNETVHSFLQKAVATGCRRFELVEGPKSDVLQSWEVPQELALESIDVLTISVEVETQAKADNEAGAVGVSRYGLRAYTPSAYVWATYRFALGTEEEGPTSIEVPFKNADANLAGVVVEMVRSNREALRQSQVANERILSTMQRMLESQMALNARYEDRHIQTITTVEELLSRREEREAIKSESATRSALMKNTIDTLKPMIALAVARFTGHVTKDPGAMAGPAVDVLFQGLFEHENSEEIMDRIVASFPNPGQQALVKDVIGMMLAKHMQRKGIAIPNGEAPASELPAVPTGRVQ